MGVVSEAQERKHKRPFAVKYICIAGSSVALVLLAFALAYPLRTLWSKPASDAIESADVKTNEIDDSAPDGFRASSGGFKRESTSTEEATPSHPTTTPTTQSPTTASTTVTPSHPTTAEPSTETVTGTGEGWGRHPRHVTVPSSTNRTNASGHHVHVWANRTRQVPSTVTYELSVKKISLQVVYECHCPRSRRFIVSQLLPVYEKLRDYMNLTLLPASRAHNKTAGNDSTSDVQCRRGKDECHSNMVQTCVLNHVEETLTAVRIIACMSKSPDPHRVGRVCVVKHGIQWKLIDACVTDKGKLYMVEVGKKAWSVTGGVGNVPLVSVQGEASYAIQVEAQTNLLGVVCDRMHHNHTACAGSHNGTTTSSSNESGESHANGTHTTTTDESLEQEEDATTTRQSV
uniref:Gamma-interferon inducible lysosomal thiol reductase n=1 Tax=Amblyomma cajennense TaxID=34607 RepID=A0A023FUQ0_AMBCJ